MMLQFCKPDGYLYAIFERKSMKNNNTLTCFYRHSLLCLSAVLILSGCFAEPKPAQLTFTPFYERTALNCAVTFEQQHQFWRYQQLQFFVSDFALQDELSAPNEWQKLNLTENNFQHANVALLGEHCGDKANWQVNFSYFPLTEKPVKLRFTLGVPFELNHANPLRQPSPLNLPSMFWVWQTGHKFLRLELAAQHDNWIYHLGSTGCKAPSPVRAPEQACLYPNRIAFEVTVSAKNNRLVFDLAELIKNLTLGATTSCQSAPGDESCRVLLENMTNLASQRVIRVMHSD